MPTETNKSPLTLPIGLIAQGVKGIVGGMAGGIRNVSQAIKDVDKEEFKDMKLGEKLKTGLGVYGKGLKGFLGGTAQGLVGDDFGLVNDREEVDEIPEQPTYRTNIDPMTGEEILPNKDLVNKYGIPMAGKPIKALTQMQGTVAHNMSAAQYKSAIKMSEISGASTLPSPVAEMADKDYDGDGKIESSKAEYFGSRDNAIKENKNK
tara:strand:+ start:487 stop:1104 length:618 start_codon:yes stop_codon:yes gene_type:complete